MVKFARNVLKNAFFNSSSALIRGIGGFLFSVVLARFLTPDLYGIYALATSLCFFVLHLDPGTNYTAVRYIAYAIGKKDKYSARGYFSFLFKIRFVLGLIFAISLAIIGKFSYRLFNKPLLFIPLEILSIFLFFFYLTDFLDACSQALQNFKYPAIRHTIYEILKFAFVLISLFIGFFYGIFLGIALAALLTFLIIFSILRQRYNFLFKGTIAKIEKKRVLKFLGFMSIGSISGMIYSYIDMIMIGIFLPSEYAGYYKAATNIIFGIGGLIAITGVLFPVFTQLEGESLENAFRKVFKYSAILSFPLTVSIAYFSGEIVKVVYGVSYLPASLPLLILSPVIIFNSINFFETLFGAKEKPEYNSAISVASMSLNVILNYFLIIKFGVVGAAIATTISRFFRITTMGILSHFILKISPEIGSIYKPLFASSVMFIILQLMPHPDNLLLGIFELCLSFAFYFAVMLLIRGIEIKDFRYAKAVFGIESFTSFINRGK